MSRVSRFRFVASVGAAFFLIAAGFTTGARPAAAAGERIRVMHFNICGVLCNYGVIDKPGWGNDIVEDVRNRAVNYRPHILTLNEICVGQFNRLKSLLGNSAWKMSGVFRPQRNDSRCKGGTGFGDAVLTASWVGRTEVYPLPNGGEQRAVLCLRTSAGGAVLACTLHLITGRSGSEGPWLKAKQLAAAAKALNDQATRGAVIVGGDFNYVPSEMGVLLDPRKGGRFFEADPQLAPTHGKKIDYILFSRAHFCCPSGDPVWSKYSDHKLLLGQATRL